MRDFAERFWEKVDQSGGPEACWPWTAATDRGYGAFQIRRRVKESAHRLAYELTVGPVPSDMHLDHTCHNGTDCEGGADCAHRRCTNPAHLQAVPAGVNVTRSALTLTGANARKTKCHAGHLFTDANTYMSKAGRRHCRTCARLRKGRPPLLELLQGAPVASLREVA